MKEGRFGRSRCQGFSLWSPGCCFWPLVELQVIVGSACEGKAVPLVGLGIRTLRKGAGDKAYLQATSFSQSHQWITLLSRSEPSWASHFQKAPYLDTATWGPSLQYRTFKTQTVSHSVDIREEINKLVKVTPCNMSSFFPVYTG